MMSAKGGRDAPPIGHARHSALILGEFARHSALILGEFARRLWMDGAEDADGDAAALEQYLRAPPFQKGRMIGGSDDIVALSNAEHKHDAVDSAVQHLPSLRHVARCGSMPSDGI